MGATVTPTLRFDRVSFSYGAVQALSDVSFALDPGERVALLGRNGAGKSTLLRLVTGLARPRVGTVWVGDWDTRDATPDRLARRVGSVFQHADQQLFARTLEDDVAFGPRAIGLAPAEVASRVARALAALELGEHVREHPYDLPPALRKLAALAGALALEPALLVLDEPTAGLDRALRERVNRALLERSAAGAAVLVITHDLTFAAESLDRALVLDRGRLARDSSLPGLLGEGAGGGGGGALEALGLLPPPVASLSAALALPGRPIRAADAARALARVAGGESRHLD
jgi:energy-coupling factor transport system ATP-binding protein